VPNYGADVASFIEWIGRPVLLAGHSLGGAVATYLAGARPDLVAGALLEDPPLYHGDREFFATTIFPKAFEAARDTMRRLQDEGAGRDGVRAVLLAQPTPTGGDPADEATPATIESRVDAFLACDPSVFDPAITGDAIGGWDPDTPIPESVPLTLLRADPGLYPAFLPADEARFRRAAPHTRIVEISGAPHGIHAFTGSTDRYLSELRSLLERAVAR
jgi:pimeloyl-ACP methyl ester carboxylesterase